jgi:predicted alpha/beta-fold hydrolase
MVGSARLLNACGYDVCSVNFRGCSGEPNRLYPSYHSGATEDLEAVVNYVCRERNYRKVFIKGFSLGGNVCLKYLGEGRALPDQLKAVVVVSVPCDLHSSLKELLKPGNILYARRFRKHLKDKLRIKQKIFPMRITEEDIRKIRTLKDFDDIYTSRAHGYKDALDYYQKCSSLQFLPRIGIPALIINARNDTFLGPGCYPVAEADENPCLFLEMPKYGGHVGFFGMKNKYYTEKMTIKFLEEGL